MNVALTVTMFCLLALYVFVENYGCYIYKDSKLFILQDNAFCVLILAMCLAAILVDKSIVMGIAFVGLGLSIPYIINGSKRMNKRVVAIVEDVFCIFVCAAYSYMGLAVNQWAVIVFLILFALNAIFAVTHKATLQKIAMHKK